MAAKDALLPDGWAVWPLKRLLSSFELGGNYPNSLTATDYPLMKMGNLGRGRFDLAKIEYVASGTTPIERHRLRRGDVLFNTRNTLDLVGKIAMWREEVECAYFNSNLMRLNFDPEIIVSNEFANLALNSEGSISGLRAMATGTTSVAAIYTRDLLTLPVVVPPPHEQKAIAAALSDADGVVAGLERVIAKKRLIKQGAMQDLLTPRRRLPGFSGEWAKVQLKDYTSHGSGNSGLIKGTLQRSGRVGDYPAFTASGPDLMLDFFEQEGDAIVISAVGSRCGKSFRARGKWSAIANTHVLRCREGLDVDFAFIFMNDEDFWLKGGTGQPFVLVRRTLERPLLLPPVNEQQAIASVLRDMDAEIQNLEARLAKARAVKEGMMQNLLTGRVRLV